MKNLKNKIIRYADENKKISRKLRKIYKLIRRSYVKVASKDNSSVKNDVPNNIYHASIQRTGSRWIKSVFSDQIVKNASGMYTYPQHEYEIGEFKEVFPRGVFVPGLYITYEAYKRIKKPNKYKTLYVTRHPKNAVISWYSSMKKTHKNVNGSVSFYVSFYRRELSSVGEKEGLKKAIKFYQVKLSYMKDWVLNSEKDENVIIIKFEELFEKTERTLNKIFEFCNLKISNKEVNKLSKKYSKKNMKKRDSERRSGEKSDYGGGKTDWRGVFTSEHERIFEEVNGNISEILGYE